jgi:predicted anti-sigma-YlaC factor YlaD
MAVNGMAKSMSESSIVYSRDEDPELVADAFPFLLKTIESLLEEVPENQSLLITACEAFTSYTQAFVAIPADVIEETSLSAAREQRRRAGKLFVRAQGYGLRALELSHEGITEALNEDPEAALIETEIEDVPALFWTGAAWALAINNAKDNMDMVADFNIANALLQRAKALDPNWNGGAIHEVMITLEAARAGGQGGSLEAARMHFDAALELSQGKKAGPYVSLAESVSIKEQNLEEFQSLLAEALAVDPDEALDHRLVNVLAQRRAQWLLDHIGDFFIDYEESEEDQ